MKKKERINLLEKALEQSDYRLEKLEKILKVDNTEIPNPEFKIGDWVWRYVTDAESKLVRIHEIDYEEDYVSTYGVSGKHDITVTIDSIIRKATDKEIEEALIQHADSNYKKGFKITSPGTKTTRRLTKMKITYDNRGLFIDSCLAWCKYNGWAEIIKPNYVNSLGECFYYGDKVWRVEIYNNYCVFSFNLKKESLQYLKQPHGFSDIFQSKESAEKWIEDNRLKYEDYSHHKVKVGDVWTTAMFIKNHWQLIGVKDNVNTGFFDEIGDKIEFN